MSQRKGRLIFAITLASIIGGCGTVNYDEQADQQLTSITQESNRQFTAWESQATAKTPVAYDKAFYDTMEADLKTLQLRMESSQDAATRNLDSVFVSLETQIENLRTFHVNQKSFSDPQFLVAESDLLNAQFAALLTFELSLKPNTATGSPSSKSTSAATANTKSKMPAAKAAVSSASSSLLTGVDTN